MPLLNLVWEKTPKLIKWPIMLAVILIWTPLRLREEAVSFVQEEVHAVVVPIQERRDLEIAQIQSDITQIKQDTRDIKNHLMNRGK